MKSLITKRAITLSGRHTSVSLEDAFWKGLKEIAAGAEIAVSDLIAIIDAERQDTNLSSAIRLFVLGVYRDHISASGLPMQRKEASRGL